MELIFTLRQTGLAKTRAAGPFLPALRNEIIVWAHLNTGCQSCKNLINIKIAQYVKENEFILNISIDMCILYLDSEQSIIYNVFVTFFPSHMMHFHVLLVSEVHALLCSYWPLTTLVNA